MTDYIGRSGNVMPRWIAYGGEWNDYKDLLNTVRREYYLSGVDLEDMTFIITGIPNKDSPKTSQDRSWEPGQELTLGFAKDITQVEDCEKELDDMLQEWIDSGRQGDNPAIAEEFTTCLTDVEEIYWEEIHSIAVLDRRGKDYEP